MASDKFLIANGLRLHYLDYGGADDLPWIVCLHGLSGNAHNFDALAPHLAAKYRVISIDVRGRGDSEWGPPTEYLPQHYATDLAAMLDEIGIGRANLVGTSMGGVIAMMFAGGWPERAERVVLNDIGPDIDIAGATRIANYVGVAPERFDNLDEVVQYYRDNYPPMAKMPLAAVRDLVQWSVKPTAGGGLAWKMDPNLRRPLRGGTAQQRLDLWVPFARITCPMLIVRGAESDILAPATASRMCKVHNRATSIEVPNVGHAPSLTEPESIAAIKQFFGV
ncbi:MAG: alpha/beta hydrolase [Candidatus Binatus sp.]|uniref:alpha/beta fold hydrolase n=1 Tax=Candidatus Binatus sp. TaxID=2811406 RepID=UPI002722F7CF|nr:alpha/beta hydrolase [Candidatus Binatus sp.]MDO8430769.1 alpha/beta hydrolase [Candidatus Binatus sp.]